MFVPVVLVVSFQLRRWWGTAADLHTTIKKISGARFEPKYLKRFHHREELEECCSRALDETVGSTDPAAAMGRAMELMRELHGLNVPRGWVPVMQALRDGSRKARSGPMRSKEAKAYVN